MQKFRMMSLAVTVTLVLTIAFATAASGPMAPVVPAAPVAEMPLPPPPAAAEERHPHVVAALESMRNAKGHLEQAEGDFEGHRARSIELLNQAIQEAQLCVTTKK